MESAVFGLIIKIVGNTAETKVNAQFRSWEEHEIRGSANAEGTVFKIGGIIHRADPELGEETEFIADHGIITCVYADT